MKVRSFIFAFSLLFAIQLHGQVTPGPRDKQPKSSDTTNIPRQTIREHYDSLINECNEMIKKLDKYIQIIQQDIESQQKQLKDLADEANKPVKAAQVMSKEEIEKKTVAIKAQLQSLNNALKIKLEQVEALKNRIKELEKEKQELLRKF